MSGIIDFGDGTTITVRDLRSVNFTSAEFWIERNGAVWRTAKRIGNKCCDCKVSIPPGGRYLDTNERQAGATWATYKVCEDCAADDSGVVREPT